VQASRSGIRCFVSYLKSLEDTRGELARKGIDRHAASAAVRISSRDENGRLEKALVKLFATKPELSYPSAARALERLGFPAPLIYRKLRAHAAEFGPFALRQVQDRLKVSQAS